MGKCPYCGAEVELKSAYEVYHTVNSRDWGNLWVCSNYPRCDAYVGCHKNTDIPLVFIGGPGKGNEGYYDNCLKEAEGCNNIHFSGKSINDRLKKRNS